MPKTVRKAPGKKRSAVKTPASAPKYSKYRGKPRDEQMRIALFGPEFEENIATLIYNVMREVQTGGTAFIVPPSETLWYNLLHTAIKTGDNSELKQAARVVKRAHLALTQPSDPLALQLLEATLPGPEPVPTIDEFMARHHPHLRPIVGDESKRRQIRMLCRMLNVRLRPSEDA